MSKGEYFLLHVGVCDTSGCDVDTTVCSLGSINCTGCNIGYQLLAKTTIGACHGELYHSFVFCFCMQVIVYTDSPQTISVRNIIVVCFLLPLM